MYGTNILCHWPISMSEMGQWHKIFFPNMKYFKVFLANEIFKKYLMLRSDNLKNQIIKVLRFLIAMMGLIENGNHK